MQDSHGESLLLYWWAQGLSRNNAPFAMLTQQQANRPRVISKIDLPSAQMPRTPPSSGGASIDAQERVDWDWLEYGHLRIHRRLFEHGILVITQSGQNLCTHYTETSFSVRKTLTPEFNIERKAGSLQIRNTHRRDEVFTPYKSFYLYENNSKNKNDRFDVFITAGCIGGFVGTDENGHSFPLIKHNAIFNSKIVNVELCQTPFSNYDLVLFQQLQAFKTIMLEKKNPKNKAILHFHLPWIDYILFVITLFIKEKITFNALNKFVKLMLVKKTDYVSELKKCFENSDILLFTESPFDNLFHVPDHLGKQEEPARFFLKPLSIAPNNPSLTSEEMLLTTCFKLLKRNKLNLLHQATWRDCWEVWDNFSAGVHTFEMFLKMANAVIPISASITDPACSLLPLSEKQIQIGTNKLLKLLKEKSNSHGISNTIHDIVFMDTVITPSHEKNDSNSLFYSPLNSDASFTNLIEKGILQKLTKNIDKTSSIDLENALSSVKRSLKCNF